MRGMPENSVDSVVTDPPYGIRFMGKAWDAPGIASGAAKNERDNANLESFKQSRVKGGGSAYGTRSAHAGQYDQSPSANRRFQEWCEEWARECLRVLKPGGYLLASGGTRTYHRLACAIEDAGFEIRDCIEWLYGSGFPKSHDVSKAIDKMAGAEREVVGFNSNHRRLQSTHTMVGEPHVGNGSITVPATAEAQHWQGWGTALKPAHEPIVMARKPLSEKSVARNVLEHGTGAINVDGCRVGCSPPSVPQPDLRKYRGHITNLDAYERNGEMSQSTQGRWPANLILSHHEDCERVGSRKVRGSGAQPRRNTAEAHNKTNSMG